MALTYSTGVEIDTPAPTFSLPATDGKTYSLDSFKDAKVLVIVFTCNHCPYAKASEDRLIEIQKGYAKRGVQIVLINPNDDAAYPEDSFSHMVARAKEKKYPFPYLRDASQEVARAYRAVCTPDIFVYDEQRHLRYHGRIDDNWQEPTKVTRHDLRLALDAIVDRTPLAFQPTASMGCSIKWKS